MGESDLLNMLMLRLLTQYGDMMKTKEVAKAMRMHENSIRAISPDALPRGGGMGPRGLVFMTADVAAYMVNHCRHAVRQEIGQEAPVAAAA